MVKVLLSYCDANGGVDDHDDDDHDHDDNGEGIKWSSRWLKPLLFLRHDIDMIWVRFPIIVAVLQICLDRLLFFLVYVIDQEEEKKNIIFLMRKNKHCWIL